MLGGRKSACLCLGLVWLPLSACFWGLFQRLLLGDFRGFVVYERSGNQRLGGPHIWCGRIKDPQETPIRERRRLDAQSRMREWFQDRTAADPWPQSDCEIPSES